MVAMVFTNMLSLCHASRDCDGKDKAMDVLLIIDDTGSSRDNICNETGKPDKQRITTSLEIVDTLQRMDNVNHTAHILCLPYCRYTCRLTCCACTSERCRHCN